MRFNLVLLGCLALGCIEHSVADPQLSQNKEHDQVFPDVVSRELDILFVIDDSRSMPGEQIAFLQGFRAFAQTLSESGLPNVHLGVISTDLGSGKATVPGCSHAGQPGLRAEPRVVGCIPPTEPYLSDVADGSARLRNYEGELTDGFACIAKLGASGCGLEQPLEAMRVTLDEDQSGFLRDDAFLAVVFVTDEDDCSVHDAGVFSLSNPDFRCAQYGVLCDGEMLAEEPKSYELCQPWSESPYLRNPLDYARRLQGLKKNPGRIVVAGLVAEGTSLRVATETTAGATMPTVGAACTGEHGSAKPAIRMQAFFDAFPARHAIASICDADYSESLRGIAQLITHVMSVPPF